MMREGKNVFRLSLFMLLTLFASSVWAMTIANDNAKVIAPNFAPPPRKCESIAQVHQKVLTPPVQLGRLYLYEGQLVLIFDGRTGSQDRTDNFWQWVEIFPTGFGRAHQGFHQQHRLNHLSETTELWVDLRAAIIRLRNSYLPLTVKPNVFRTNGKTVVLLKTGAFYEGGRYEFRIRYLEIEPDGRLNTTVKTQVTSEVEFSRSWHPVEGYRLFVGDQK